MIKMMVKLFRWWNAKLESISDLNSRILMVIIVVVLCNITLACRMIELSRQERAESYISTANLDQEVPRANIIDRNGRTIAMNLHTASLYANPREIAEPKRVAKLLHNIFPERSTKSFEQKLSADNYFQWMVRHIDPAKQKKVNDLGEIGLVMIDDTRRIYPNRNNLSHVVGNVDTDNIGVSGIEKRYDQFLRHASKQNKSLQMTIDINAQELTRKILSEHIKKQDAIGGAAIILDPHTGEVISMVSMPDYDPNKLTDASQDQLFNRATVGLYEPGSTMKALSMAAALDSGRITTSGVFNVSEPIKYGRFKINDFAARGGSLSVPEILMYSSNIGMVKIADKVGRSVQHDYLDRFGLLDKLNLELLERSKPMYPDTKNWSDLTSYTVSYGHGIAVSPLHIAAAYAPLVNGGYKVLPTFVKKPSISAKQRIISEQTSDTMKKLLRKVVLSGASRNANAKGYMVGGKTGSAEKNLNGRYRKDANVSSFCGAFPMHNPQYVVYVMLDEAKKNDYNKGRTTGGRIAAPLARDIIENVAPLLGVVPVEEPL